MVKCFICSSLNRLLLVAFRLTSAPSVASVPASTAVTYFTTVIANTIATSPIAATSIAYTTTVTAQSVVFFTLLFPDCSWSLEEVAVVWSSCAT